MHWKYCVTTGVGVALAVLGSLSASSQADAQVLKGQVLGTIADSTGGVIPGATVLLTETNTNVAREGSTNESGLYVFPNLAPGTYEVDVEMEGFNRAVRGGIVLLPNTTVRIDLEMQPSAVTETVMVTGAAPILQTDRADTGAKLETKQMRELPLLYK